MMIVTKWFLLDRYIYLALEDLNDCNEMKPTKDGSKLMTVFERDSKKEVVCIVLL